LLQCCALGLSLACGWTATESHTHLRRSRRSS